MGELVGFIPKLLGICQGDPLSLLEHPARLCKWKLVFCSLFQLQIDNSALLTVVSKIISWPMQHDTSYSRTLALYKMVILHCQDLMLIYLGRSGDLLGNMNSWCLTSSTSSMPISIHLCVMGFIYFFSSISYCVCPQKHHKVEGNVSKKLTFLNHPSSLTLEISLNFFLWFLQKWHGAMSS